MRRPLVALLTFMLACWIAPIAEGKPVFFTDRAAFLAAVGESITDDYSGYGVTPADAPAQLSDAEMSDVLGQTQYEALSHADLNLVGNVFRNSDDLLSYCSGCNGNFRLSFATTSLSTRGGVFGVGVDILLHTSRHTAIGDVDPNEVSLEGTVLVEFKDGEILAVTIPADVGFFGYQPYFLGLTDRRGIRSLTFGIEPVPLRHSWIIDNLTIAAPPRKGKPK